MFESDSARELETRVLSGGSIEELRQPLAGRLVWPGDPGYDLARRVWNGASDKHPAIIAQCAGTTDVVEAVRFARSERLSCAGRGGAHARVRPASQRSQRHARDCPANSIPPDR